MQILTRRALNRATLDRQLLLRRADLAPLQAIEHLVGLQAQTPHTWYVGLWSRLAGCRPEEVAALLTQRRAVRIALMRSTIHLVSAADALALRPLVQPALDRDLFTNHPTAGRCAGWTPASWSRPAGRSSTSARAPRRELGRLLAQRWPDRDPAGLAYAVRNLLPVVQTPPRGVWGASGQPVHAPLESWVGRRAGHRPADRLAGPAVPGRVRSGDRTRRADLVRADPAGGGARAAPAPARHVPRRERRRTVRPARRAPPRPGRPRARAVPVRLRQPAAVARGPDEGRHRRPRAGET